MKIGVTAQLGQQLRLTPQLLQSIRLLQLDGLQLEQEIQSALALNPLLEVEEDESALDPTPPAPEVTALDGTSFDELPESSLWDVPGTGWQGGDEDRMQRVEATESSDPHVRVLARLSMELAPEALRIAAFWLQHTDDAGYLTTEPETLAAQAALTFGVDPRTAESLRQRLLQGECPGLAARDLRECLLAQLQTLPGRVPARPVAAAILRQCLELLARHDHNAIADHLGLDTAQVDEAVGLILSLQPRPGETLAPAPPAYVVPDVVAWHADGSWRVALNPAASPRLRVHAGTERMLERAGDQAGTQRLRELLQEARWLTRGLSVRYDTLLQTARAIVERQAAFLSQGEEAMAPLTLKAVADAIGMHESTVSRITTGKYIQTPRGTFELKRFFAVRLEGAHVSGLAVRAMVRRLIESEPPGRPLADEAIAGLLARQGIQVARRTVTKYREQLHIASARDRRRGNVEPLAKAV